MILGFVIFFLFHKHYVISVDLLRFSDNITLEKRIHYLSHSLVCMKSDKSGSAPHIGVLFQEVEDTLQVAQVQLKVIFVFFYFSRHMHDARENDTEISNFKTTPSNLPLNRARYEIHIIVSLSCGAAPGPVADVRTKPCASLPFTRPPPPPPPKYFQFKQFGGRSTGRVYFLIYFQGKLIMILKTTK